MLERFLAAMGGRRELACRDGTEWIRYEAVMTEVQAMEAEAEIGVPAERLCRVFELAIADSPLEQTLGELIRIVESTSRTGMLGSILLLDGRHLRHGAAPSLPEGYCKAIDGGEIGPVAGSCGTAAFRGRPVFVSDIETDPLWAEFKSVALPHGLRACWSTPIITSGPKVLGTFAMYHREPREATVRDLALVDLVIQTAALVIDRKRAQDLLTRSAA
jgi:GAF domain-containing protein